MDNVAYFSGNNGLYWMKIPGANSSNPTVIDITPSIVQQSYIIVPLPMWNELMAIGMNDQYIYSFFVGDTGEDGTTNPSLIRKIRMHNPFPFSPDLTSGFRCKFALPSVDQNTNYIYMSGYPSNKIMRMTSLYFYPVERLISFHTEDYHIDKFALNLNYIVVPILNQGKIDVWDIQGSTQQRLMTMEFTGGIISIAHFGYTPESDYFLMHSVD